MLKTFLAYGVILSIFLTIVSASIHITYPQDVTYSEIAKASSQSGDPTYLKTEKLGNIAPGQTLRINIARTSGTMFFWVPVFLIAGRRFIENFRWRQNKKYYASF